MIAVIVAVLLIAGGATALLWPHGGLRDMNGNAVALDAAATPAGPQLTDMDPVDDTNTRFAVPSVGLDVPLGALTAVGDEITPPGFTSAYLVRNLGVTPQNAPEGTVFVVMHSLRDGAVGPGNYLIDVDSGTAAVHPGDEVDVSGVAYTVTGASDIIKTAIADDDDIWADQPGRLVVITCLQRPGGGPSHDNIVITAQRTAG
ncbi:class F sortase [Microbacterium protaetiae]|uniref:Class F sortase n=2 Tax=Microbacterium protaetiae TaxID=2509458 RepID=A0A4P6EKG5_9MICO|nr:class F sortase [Microbacterium protaetiae]